MKKIILLLIILSGFLVSEAQKGYKITRYEQKSDALFICINHTKKPVYIEHFFTDAERKDSLSIKATIEELVAELLIKADEYVEPEKFVSRIDKAEKFKTDSVKVKAKKVEILARRKAEKDKEVREKARQDSTKELPTIIKTADSPLTNTPTLRAP